MENYSYELLDRTAEISVPLGEGVLDRSLAEATALGYSARNPDNVVDLLEWGIDGGFNLAWAYEGGVNITRVLWNGLEDLMEGEE